MSAIPIIAQSKDFTKPMEIDSAINIFKLVKTNDILNSQGLISLLEKGQINPNIKEDGTGTPIVRQNITYVFMRKRRPLSHQHFN
jgi:hypothetical protein